MPPRSPHRGLGCLENLRRDAGAGLALKVELKSGGKAADTLNMRLARGAAGMGWLLYVLLVCVLAVVPRFAQRAAAEEQIHVVQKGDTLWALSRRYGVKTEDILFLNGLDDAAMIRTGQSLRIPSEPLMASSASAGSASRSGTGSEYQARKGDTLFGIARSFGVTYQALRAANNLAPGYVLKAGDTLKIPGVAGSAAAPAKTASGAASGTGAQKPAAAQPAKEAPKALVWPVKVREAARMTGKLSGVVLTGEHTEAVRAIAAGTVVSVGPFRGFGRVAIVRNEAGYLYVYGGCESLSVREGDRIASGAELGKLGVDAVSGSPNLFFMVYRNNAPIDPEKAPRS